MPGWGQFFMTQRGQFRMAFDTAGGLPPCGLYAGGLQHDAAGLYPQSGPCRLDP
jgi:hypothetical protein